MRLFPLLAFLVSVAAPAAEAADSSSLRVTISPGAWVATRIASGLAGGLGAGLDWNYRRQGAWISMGGHVASSVVFTEATPLRVRWGPPSESFRPFLGAGASFLLPWFDSAQGTHMSSTLRLGGEASAGADVPLGSVLILAGEGRYQNFSAGSDPLSPQRQEIVSVYLGLGFRL